MSKALFRSVILFSFCFFSFSSYAQVPQQPSRVYVKGAQLIVQKRQPDGSLGRPQVYIIKGVTWSPATEAPHTGPDPFNPSEEVDYGFFFDWTGRYPAGHEVFNYWLKNEFYSHYLKDISLMKEMNVNTVRFYTDLGDEPEVYRRILDEFYRNDIMVIMTVVVSKGDIDSSRYRKVINWCRDHPAILMWSLGNEWNFDYNKYWGYGTVRQAAKATNDVARHIKYIDLQHPVSSSLGGRFTDSNYDNTIEAILTVCPDIDIWAINVYRGKTFTNLFDQWKAISSKPLYISEFGTDSFKTEKYDVVRGYQADNCIGQEDQNMQAQFNLALWQELRKYLSAFNPDEPCLGGIIHSFNDSLWKVGSYHVGLGGLIDYQQEATSYNLYNSEGFYLPGSHPDGISNEEYFGLVDAQRRPKKSFWVLKKYYKELDSEQGSFLGY